MAYHFAESEFLSRRAIAAADRAPADLRRLGAQGATTGRTAASVYN